MKSRVASRFLLLSLGREERDGGEEGRLYWLAPLLGPLPTRSSRGEEDDEEV